jgi:FkbM family methyltransferase
LYTRYSRTRLECRCGASDLDLFKQIFIDREYRCLDDAADANLVIDCGANVGYSAAYFLSRFPRCRLIAVEPDESNFALLNRNLQPFRGRFTALRAGVWPRVAGLRFSEEKFGDGREWSYTVREAEPGEVAQIPAIDIGSLLRMSGCERISVLKIDVEGSEKAIFSENFEQWLDKVDALVIELHGPECENAFQQALDAYAFDVSRCDELTVARRRDSLPNEPREKG